MSEDDLNVTSNQDLATATVATNDADVSSAFNQDILGNALSAAISGSAELTAGSTTASASLTDSGAISSAVASATDSAYSAAALDQLNTTYYAGSLARDYVATTTHNVITPDGPYAIANTSNLTPRLDASKNYASNITLANAGTDGQANLYFNNNSVQTSQTAVRVSNGTLSIGDGTPGHAILSNTSRMNVNSGGKIVVGEGNALLVGDKTKIGKDEYYNWNSNTGQLVPSTSQTVFGQGDLRLMYDDYDQTAMRLAVGDNAYISAHGYIGGVIDKGFATSGGDASALSNSLRTGNMSIGDNVQLDADTDFGVTGDYRGSFATASAVVGNNVLINLGGNMGAILNASMTIGDNATIHAASDTGNGLFVGSGGYMSIGQNLHLTVYGGAGAGYLATEFSNAVQARLLVGNNASIFLDDDAYGYLAAEAGGLVSIGNDLNLRGLGMSVGWAQDATTGSNVDPSIAKSQTQMFIGNSAVISLGANGLAQKGSDNVAIGGDGAIVADGSNTYLKIGDAATINAGQISVGNFSKDYNGKLSGTSVNKAWFAAGNNNYIEIGSGATISLASGIGLDGNNNSLTLHGGLYYDATGALVQNTLSAGYFSAGAFYSTYVASGVNNGNTKSTFYVGSGANVKVGDDYAITLTSTGGSNTGNLEVRASSDVFTFGNHLSLNANSLVVGDYYKSAGATNVYSAGTSKTTVTFGNDADINLSGNFLFTGSSNTVAFGDRLDLTVSSVSLTSGSGFAGANNNTLSFGNAASVHVSSGFLDAWNYGSVVFQSGSLLEISKGNLSFTGSNINDSRNVFSMGNNGVLAISNGGIVATSGNQAVVMGDSTTLFAQSANMVGNRQSIVVGSNASVTFSQGNMILRASSAAEFTGGDNVNLSVNGSIVLSGGALSGSFAVGSNAIVSGTHLDVSGSNASTVFGASAHITLPNGIATSAVNSNLFSAGDSAVISANGIFVSTNANATVSMGNAVSAYAGSGLIVGDNINNGNLAVTIGNGLVFSGAKFIVSANPAGTTAQASVTIGDNGVLALSNGTTALGNNSNGIIITADSATFQMGNTGSITGQQLTVSGQNYASAIIGTNLNMSLQSAITVNASNTGTGRLDIGANGLVSASALTMSGGTEFAKIGAATSMYLGSGILISGNTSVNFSANNNVLISGSSFSANGATVSAVFGKNANLTFPTAFYTNASGGANLVTFDDNGILKTGSFGASATTNAVVSMGSAFSAAIVSGLTVSGNTNASMTMNNAVSTTVGSSFIVKAGTNNAVLSMGNANSMTVGSALSVTGGNSAFAVMGSAAKVNVKNGIVVSGVTSALLAAGSASDIVVSNGGMSVTGNQASALFDQSTHVTISAGNLNVSASAYSALLSVGNTGSVIVSNGNIVVGQTGNYSATISGSDNITLSANGIVVSGTNYAQGWNTIAVGNNANINIGTSGISSLITDYGSFTAGDNLHLSTTGGWVMSSYYTGSTSVGNSATIHVDQGINWITSYGGNVTMGQYGAYGNDLDLSASSWSIQASGMIVQAIGDRAKVTVDKQLDFSAYLAQSVTIGSDANLLVGGSASFKAGANGYGQMSVLMGSNATFSAGSNIYISGYNTLFSAGNNAHITAGSSYIMSGGTNASTVFGDNLVFSTLGSASVADVSNGLFATGSNAKVNVGSNFNMSGAYESATFGNNLAFSAAGVNISGTTTGLFQTGTSGTVNVTSNFTMSGANESAVFGSNLAFSAAGVNISGTTTGLFQTGVSGVVRVTSNFIMSGATEVVSVGSATSMTVGSNYLMSGTNQSTIIDMSAVFSTVGSVTVNAATSGLFQVGSNASAIINKTFNMSGSNEFAVVGNAATFSASGATITGTTSGVFSVTSNAKANVISNLSIVGGNGAYETLTVDSTGVLNVGSNYFTSGSYINTNVNGQLNVGGGIAQSAYNSGQFVVGTGAAVSVNSGIQISGNGANNFIVSNGGTVSVNSAGIGVSAAGGAVSAFWGSGAKITVNSGNVTMSASTSVVISAGQNASFVVSNGAISAGHVSYTNINSGALISAASGITLDALGLGINSVVVSNGAKILFGNGGYVQSGAAYQSTTIGDNVTMSGAQGFVLSGNLVSMGTGDNFNLTAGSVSVRGSAGYAATVSMGNNATWKLTSGGATIFGSGQSAMLQAGNNFALSATGGVLVSAPTGTAAFNAGTGLNLDAPGVSVIAPSGSASISFGDNATLRLGANNLVVSGTSMGVNAGSHFVLSGANINFGATGGTNAQNVVTIGDNASFTLTGNVNLPVMNNVNGGVNVNIGNNASFNIGGAWNINQVSQAAAGNYTGNQNVVIGNGATGYLGDVNMSTNNTYGANTINTFNTGNANNLSAGNINITGSGTFTAGGKLSGKSLVLQYGAVFSATPGAHIDLNSVTLNGKQGTSAQTSIYVGPGAVLNIATLHTANATTTTPPTIVVDGGYVYVAGNDIASKNVTVDFNSKANGISQWGGTIQENSGKLNINNFALDDKLVFDLADGSVTDSSRYKVTVSGNTLTVTLDGVTIATFAYTGVGAPLGVNIVQRDVDGTGQGKTKYQLVITKCFLTGTNILTPNGEVCVEDLREGDDVITLKDGKHVAQRIVWAGNMEVDVNRYENKDALYPVRIKAHAFGLNQPCRDLLITPEHTVYVNGGLIPARMLVNGRSIIIDRSMDSFTVYHIETEEHSILLSENLTTESYLNTDDRHQFNNGNAINLHLTFNERAGHKNWEEHAAAPLMVAREQVEPIWSQLDRNATQQGYAPVAKAQTTRDPALCLITQHGETLQPVDVRGNAYSFYVPANVRVVAMRSRAGLPSEVVGPFVDDRRMLGVLVSKMSVLGEHSATVLPSDMSDLSGWYPAEMGRNDRWTKGFATLPSVITEATGKVKLIKIELTDTAEYFEDDIDFVSKIA